MTARWSACLSEERYPGDHCHSVACRIGSVSHFDMSKKLHSPSRLSNDANVHIHLSMHASRRYHNQLLFLLLLQHRLLFLESSHRISSPLIPLQPPLYIGPCSSRSHTLHIFPGLLR